MVHHSGELWQWCRPVLAVAAGEWSHYTPVRRWRDECIVKTMTWSQSRLLSMVTGNIFNHSQVLHNECRNSFPKEHHHFKSTSRAVTLVNMVPYSNKNLKDTPSFYMVSIKQCLHNTSRVEISCFYKCHWKVNQIVRDAILKLTKTVLIKVHTAQYSSWEFLFWVLFHNSKSTVHFP